MKITEDLLKEMEANPDGFSDGIITPEGDYLLAKDGHMKTLMTLLPYSENEIWKMVPEGDSILFWLIEKTSCVITDYNSSIGMTMTSSQKDVFDALVAHNIIASDYFDLSNRKK